MATFPQRLASRCFVMLACCLASGLSACSTAAESRGVGRIAPPAAITCDPNHLTAWFGVVSGYRRGRTQTWLRISTDYDTVEQTTLDHAGAADASVHYLLWGAPFTAKDWPAVEQAPGRLLRGMRAVVWVCDDGKTAPVVDWQPARE